MLEPFSAKMLPTFDGGKIAATLDLELDAVRRDLLSRPHTKGARKITLTLSLTPRAAEDSDELDSVDFGWDVKTVVPKRKPRSAVNMTVRRGQMLWNEWSPDNPDQLDLRDAGADLRPARPAQPAKPAPAAARGELEDNEAPAMAQEA